MPICASAACTRNSPRLGYTLQAPYRVDRLQIHLANALGTAPLLILQARFSLFDPTPQGLVDGVAGDPQVAGSMAFTLQPSAWSFTMTILRSLASSISW